MKRVPGIHISSNGLSKILQELVNNELIAVTSLDELVDQILLMAKSKALTHRSISITNQYKEKIADRINKSTLDLTSLFANLLYVCRKKLKHRGIKPIEPGTKDWLLIKDITEDAINFCTEFEIDERDGFIKYITMGLNKMGGTFALAKFKRFYEPIIEEYSAISEIQKDPTPVITSNLFKHFQRKIIDKTGIPLNIENDFTKMVFFKRVVELCKELKVEPTIYIDAQFAGLEWTDGIPEPKSMTGPKAKDRLVKYLFEKGIKLSEKKVQMDWGKILKA